MQTQGTKQPAMNILNIRAPMLIALLQTAFDAFVIRPWLCLKLQPLWLPSSCYEVHGCTWLTHTLIQTIPTSGNSVHVFARFAAGMGHHRTGITLLGLRLQKQNATQLLVWSQKTILTSCLFVKTLSLTNFAQGSLITSL